MPSKTAFTLDDAMVIEIHDTLLMELATGSAFAVRPDSKDGYCGNLTCGNLQCLDYLCVKV